MPRSSSALLSSLKLSSLTLCTLIFSTLSFAAPPDRIIGVVTPQQFVKLSAGVPRQAQPQYDQGPVDPSLKLGYMTLLTVPSAGQQKAINRLLAQQQDQRSPQYHQWLMPEQYADRFGLSSNDIQKITNWLQSQGFSINNVARGRNWIAFSGTVAQVENTFQTSLHTFNVDGELHFANIAPPSIPAALSGIVSGIRGLNDFRPKADLQRRNPDYSFPLGGGQFALFVAPGDVTTIYDIAPLYTAGIDGTGQKLAVMGRTDVYLADLNDFRSAFGLSTINCTPDSNGLVTTSCNTTNFRYVLNGTDPGVNPKGDDLPEADLDLEWSGATARNAQIIYVNSGGTAGDVFDAYYYTIDNNLAPVITMSYGFCEFDEALSGFLTSDEAELTKANTEGITFMNSSGDRGAASCDFNPPNANPPFSPAVAGLAVSYPASSPEITGVGGTMIPIGEYNSTYWSTTNGGDGGSALSYIPENGWNDDTEIGAFCAANPTNSNCHPSGGVAITNAQTAQEDFWIGSTGGGASNCTTVNGSNVCTGGFAKPSWQTVTITGQASARFSPDISLLGSSNFPGYIFCSPVFEFAGGTNTASSCATGINNSITTYNSIVGGTSVSSPVFAGMVSLLNQYLAGSATPGLGNINPKLYALAQTAPTAFHQVTSGLNAPGSNIVYCQPGTPASQPAALRCPAGGTMGYLAANADATTGYNLVTGLGSVDVNNLAIVWAASRTTTTLTVQPSSTQITLGQSVTLTATVSPTSATGVVTFVTGSTTLGTATLASGVAAISTSSLPVGADTITASYAGDGYNMPSTGTTVVTVTAPTFKFLSTGSSSHTVLSGQTTRNYSFTATPTSGPTFVNAVSFSCGFSPTDPTLTASICSYSVNSGPPSTSATIPAGSGTSTVTMTIQTAGPNNGVGSTLRHRSDNRLPWLPLALPLAGVVMVGFAGRKMSKAATVAGMCLMLTLAGFLIACGSSSPPVSITSVTGSSSSIYPQNAGWTNATATFTAVLANDSGNKGVTWAVTTANGGTIAKTDATHATYTPPTIAAGLPSNVTITATAVADTSKTGTASIALNPTTVPGNYIVTVTAAETGATSQTANVALVDQ